MTNEDAIKMLKSKMDGRTDTSYEWAETVRMAIEALEEKPKGEWEKYGHEDVAYDIEGNVSWGQKRRCTNCGFIKTYVEDFGFYSVCPNCGAVMQVKNELSRVNNELNSDNTTLFYSITNGDNYIGKEGEAE